MFADVRLILTILALCLPLLQLLAHSVWAQPCRVRREVHSLSDGDWQRLLRAFQRIKEPGFNRELAAMNKTSATAPVNCTALLLDPNLPTSKQLGLDKIQCQLKQMMLELKQYNAVETGHWHNQLSNVYETVEPLLTGRPNLLGLEQGERVTIDRLSSIHSQYRDLIHGTPIFLEWHRRFVFEMETALRRVDPGITLPYWDWSRDSAAPERSVVFRYIGTSSGSESRCLSDGPFARWRFDRFGGGECISRAFDPETGEAEEGHIYSRRCVRAITTLSRTERSFIERWTHLHDNFHWWVGGSLADTRFSASDPIFYLHHAFIDKVWVDWLRLNGRSIPNSADLPGLPGRAEECVMYEDQLGGGGEWWESGASDGAEVKLPQPPLFRIGQFGMSLEMFQRQRYPYSHCILYNDSGLSVCVVPVSVKFVVVVRGS